MERLTAQDLMSLWPDELGWPMDIGALAILDGTGLLDPDGRFRIEDAREAVRRRLHLVPRFRQLLYKPPLGLGGPLWVDAPSVDLTEHIRVRQLTAPADEAQLLLAVERLRARRLRRSRPLWEMWFLAGLPDGRIGMYLKAHHTIADGVAGVALLGTLLDVEATVPPTPERPRSPAPMPTKGELLRDILRRRTRAVRGALTRVAHPVGTARRARAAWPAIRSFYQARAPRTSLNRPIGADRRLALIRCRLDLARRVAHAHDAKVNDVLLTVVAGGLRDLLRSRGEPVDVVLRAFVPVSLHRERLGAAQGNQDAVMVAPLPIGEPDVVARLRRIAKATAERKSQIHAPGLNAFPNSLVQRAAWHMVARQRFVNVTITNVPGPTTPLYFAGAPLLEVFPVVPITGNLTLGIGALSYAGQFNITAVADRDACPDVEVFAEGLRESLRALTGAPHRGRRLVHWPIHADHP
ncbi:MAG TPA: wax ester/triacylglycerol synthase family O-acyltransferase [Pseudonocardiaceae bacterium]